MHTYIVARVFFIVLKMCVCLCVFLLCSVRGTGKKDAWPVSLFSRVSPEENINASTSDGPRYEIIHRFIHTFIYFLHPIHYPCASLVLLPEETRIRGRMAGPPAPSPLRHLPFFFYREKNSAFSSLVDSRRIVPILV